MTPANDADAHLPLPRFGGRTNLREDVGDALRALLVTGQMRPGTIYSAPSLATEFGVSATPIREAMLDLVGEGLVEVVRNKGFRVTVVDEAELDALAELRSLIEIPVMAMVASECKGPVADAVEELRVIARTITEAAASQDLVTYTEADTEFHTRFLALHGNTHVVTVVRDMRHRSRLYGLKGLATAGLLAEMAVEHERMVDAALARDTEGMRALMTQHLGHLRSSWAEHPG